MSTHVTRIPYFNPRSRVGSDDKLGEIENATEQFQSTLPRGERLVSAQASSARLPFQSTLPRGERRAFPQHTRHQSYFNPRSRVGSDSKNA